jgi:hypothetical protein
MHNAPMKTYIEQRSIPEPNTGCWLWMLSLGSHGYPQGGFNSKVVLAHRLSYEAFIGAIPKNYEIDHKCRNKSCVNPGHLEATTKIANRRRQFGYVCDAVLSDELCPKGHTYRRSRGNPVCDQCKAEIGAAYRLKKKAAI